ncbi:unnamed protein product [Brassica rapa subsp. trilocularis]
MALINLEAHVLLLSGGFVVLMLQSKLLFIQPDWNLTMTIASAKYIVWELHSRVCFHMAPCPSCHL